MNSISTERNYTFDIFKTDAAYKDQLIDTYPFPYIVN